MLRFRALVLILSLCLPLLSGADTLRIGTVSSYPEKAHEHYRLFAELLEKQLLDTTINDVELVFADNLENMIRQLKQNQIDLYMDSAVVSSYINHQSLSRVLVRQWKEGKSHYRSVIFTRKGSPIRSLDSLSGGSIVFKEPQSSSGYLIPRIYIQAQRIDLKPLVGKQIYAAHDHISYVFSYSNQRTLDWVLDGRYNAGVVSSTYFEALPTEIRAQLRVIDRSYKVPRHLVSIRGGLPDALTDRLRNILLSMHKTEVGRQAMTKLYGTTLFDRYPPHDAILLDVIRADLIHIFE